jgi:hypothetical protein
MNKYDPVRLLLEATVMQFRKTRGDRFGDYQIFVEVLGNRGGMYKEIFLPYLHDVSTCPPEVIRWCQERINTVKA